MNIGKIKITENIALVVEQRVITAGAIGATVDFLFDSTWDGYSKTLVWKAGDVTKDDTTATGVVPAEVLATPGVTLKVGVYGVRDGVATPTLWANLGKILPGADPSGDESTNPSLPVWEQVRADIERLEAASAQAVEAAGQSTEAANAAVAAAYRAQQDQAKATEAAESAQQAQAEAAGAAGAAVAGAESAQQAEVKAVEAAEAAAQSAAAVAEGLAELDDVLGDIEDTLDAILAIQAELIGGEGV